MLKRREASPNWKLWGVVDWRSNQWAAPDEIRWDHAAYWMRDALGWIPEDCELSSIDQVHLALQRFDPLVSRLAAGMDRPHAQFIPQLDQRRNGALLQEISGFERVADSVMTLLQLRGIAAVEPNQEDMVFESLAVMTKLQQALSNEVRTRECYSSLRCIGYMENILVSTC